MNRRRTAVYAVAATAFALCAAAVVAADGPAPDAAAPWTVIGQQGLVRFVLVPAPQQAEQAAYERQIERLCDPERTCFLNFYTNSTGAALALPLPAAIEQEATATFRRSAKNGVQILTWSCRLKLPGRECF